MARILVVDDEKGIRDILEKYLTAQGHEVLTAASGQEALEMLDTHEPDLMTLDLSMPGMDGYEVCRSVRGEAKTNSLPILIISGNTNPEEQMQAFKMGANEYITKPFKIDEVIGTIKTLSEQTRRGHK